MYRISDEEVQAQQREFKRNYPPFEAFKLTDKEKVLIVDKFCALLSTQNGMDTDDYCIIDGNKMELYLKDTPKNSRVLVLGTGTGREVLVGKEMGFETAGTTLGSRNVYFGQKMLGLSDRELVECANEVLPFPDNYFDAVVGFQVFEHAMNPFLFLMEVRRVMRYGGKIIMEWPPAEDYHMGQNPHHQICYCPGQADSLFQKACFQDIKLYYNNLEPVPEEHWWSAKNHGYMLCIEGIKSRHEQPFVHMYLGVR
jgi:SAM-dependent methyltransferase